MQSRLPMHLSPRCGARTRTGRPCRSPAMVNGRCRMHGGASPGAPRGNANARREGLKVRQAELEQLEESLHDLDKAKQRVRDKAREVFGGRKDPAS